MFFLCNLRHKTILVVVSMVATLPRCEAVLRRLRDSSRYGGEPIRREMKVAVCDVHVYRKLNGGRRAGYCRHIYADAPAGICVLQQMWSVCGGMRR
jgi:hypothetical protein